MTYRYPLVRVARYGMDDFAERAGIHPEVLRRFVALGLLDAERDQAGQLWFAPGQLAITARVKRLHAELALNYAAIGLVLDLLDEIDHLRVQARLSRN